MRFGRKLPAAAAVIGMAVGLTFIAPSPTSSQTPPMLHCVGVPGSVAEMLINLAIVDFPNGYVPIPFSIQADVPADLDPGGTGNVNFSWVLDPGEPLRLLAVNAADIQTLDANLLGTSIVASSGSGGPYPFQPGQVTLVLQPTPQYPTVTASGSITAGSEPISYTFNVGRLDITIITSTDPELLELDCVVDGNNIIAGTSVGGVAPPPPGGGGVDVGTSSGSSSSGSSGASTTISQGTTGSSQARVTG